MFHLLGMFFLFTIVLWFAALIHCVLNKYLRGGEKVAWTVLFLFTSWIGWIGSLIYFVYWFGYAKQRRSQPASQFQPRYQTYQVYQPTYAPPPQQNDERQQQNYASYEQSYTPYEQGYQPVKRSVAPVKPFIAEAEQPQEIVSPLYEQPQVMYPEDPR